MLYPTMLFSTLFQIVPSIAINQNRDLLETITMQLLETEAIEGEALHQLLNQVKAAPVI
jgi:ATP-dependent Zn protease